MSKRVRFEGTNQRIAIGLRGQKCKNPASLNNSYEKKTRSEHVENGCVSQL